MLGRARLAWHRMGCSLCRTLSPFQEPSEGGPRGAGRGRGWDEPLVLGQQRQQSSGQRQEEGPPAQGQWTAPSTSLGLRLVDISLSGHYPECGPQRHTEKRNTKPWTPRETGGQSAKKGWVSSPALGDSM